MGQPHEKLVRMFRYPFPLRENVTPVIELPTDLTAEEAERICIFVKSLAVVPKEAK